MMYNGVEGYLNMDFEYEEIYDCIFVYKKLLPNHQELYRSLRESKERNSESNFYGKWTPWYTFGLMALINEGNGDPEISNLERQRFYEVDAATKAAMRHYQEVNGISDPSTGDELPILTTPGPCLYREYTSDNSPVDPKAMSFHVDFVAGDFRLPGEKFMITCCTYPNDDYEGGEIEFWADDKAIRYKPKAGEILVFPSGNPLFPGNGRPYFHSVCPVGAGEKYLFRAFGKYVQPETEEWNAGVAQYGEEKWKSIVRGDDSEKKDVYSKVGPSLMIFDKEIPYISKELFDSYGGKMTGNYSVRSW